MDESPLSKLPPEMLNHILEYAVQSDTPLILRMNMRSSKSKAIPLNKLKHPMAVTATCRQMHDTCVQMFYAINEFVIESLRSHAASVLQSFCQTIGEKNASSLRSVRLAAYEPVDASSNYIFFDETFIQPMSRFRRVARTLPDCSILAEVIFRFPLSAGVNGTNDINFLLDLQNLESWAGADVRIDHMLDMRWPAVSVALESALKRTKKRLRKCKCVLEGI